MKRIVCIEDEASLRRDICEELQENGYEVIEASDGVEGLQLIRTKCPDLVLCDVRMPNMDGFELLRQVRESSATWGTVPFLFLTAYGEREHMLKGLRDGADDFLTKPIDYDVLLARIETSLRQVHRVKEYVKKTQGTMQKELDRAHIMQRDLLPSHEFQRAIEAACNLKLTSHYEPSTDLGGDIWGLQLISATKVMFYLVDFSGHGIAAAMNTFRLYSKIDSEPIGDLSPARYLERINSWLCKQLQTGQFATVLIGILDREKSEFQYAAAGTQPPIKIDFQDKEIEVGDGKGVPLGVSDGVIYEDRILSLKKNDALFFYSDALIEHGRKEKLNLGQIGLEAMVLKVAGRKSLLSVEDIIAPFLELAPRPLDDDLTAVCCVWKG
ncbi:MAG: SpoIIE family protein phosphatase [Methylocystaceae bacterium]|nr:SpoIIE family protein phosphatase [Methylocystaceae bacterium]